MRKFLKHVAHDLIGESAYGAGTNRSANSKNPTLVTYGSKGTGSRLDRSAHRYTEFDVEENMAAANDIKMDTYAGNHRQGVATASAGDDERSWVDDDSAKAIVKSKQIMQTTTVTVERN